MVGGGLGALGLAFALRKPIPESTCEPAYGSAYSPCPDRQADNSLPLVLGLVGIGSAVAGLTLVGSGSSLKVEQSNPQPHSTRETTSCVPPRDLLQLALVLKAGRKLVPVRLDADGNASGVLPDDYPLRPGAALPIIVYRVPRGAEHILKRGLVLGILLISPAPTSTTAE